MNNTKEQFTISNSFPNDHNHKDINTTSLMFRHFLDRVKNLFSNKTPNETLIFSVTMPQHPSTQKTFTME